MSHFNDMLEVPLTDLEYPEKISNTNNLNVSATKNPINVEKVKKYIYMTYVAIVLSISTIIISSIQYHKYCSENLQLFMIIISVGSLLFSLLSLILLTEYQYDKTGRQLKMEHPSFVIAIMAILIVILVLFTKTNYGKCDHVVYILSAVYAALGATLGVFLAVGAVVMLCTCVCNAIAKRNNQNQTNV